MKTKKKCAMCGGGRNLRYLCKPCELLAESKAQEQRGDLDREDGR